MNTVVLSFNAKHYEMIRRCAELEGMSPERWIVLATEGSLRSDIDEFSITRIKLDFNDDDLNDVIDEILAEGGA